MTDPRRLFLHIGLPKTATTYLQGNAWNHKTTLGERGLLVPGRGPRRHLLASQEFRRSPRLSRLVEEGDRPWVGLTEEVREWSGDALISHEFFASALPEHIRDGVAAVPDHEVHVVVTARPMVDVFISRWQEWIKNGNIGPIDEFPQANARPAGDWGWGTIDLADVLERWGAVIAPERIHVLPLPRSSNDPAEIWWRFLEVLGVAAEGLAPAASRANQSLGLVEVEVLRKANVHLRDELTTARDKGGWVRGFLGETILAGGAAERFRPNDEVLAGLVQRGERALSLLDSGGFDLRGSLEDLRSRDVSDRRHPGQVGAEEIADRATAALATMTLEARAAAHASESTHSHEQVESGLVRRTWKAWRR